MDRAGILVLFDLLLLMIGIKDWKERKIQNRDSMMILLLSVAGAAVMSEITLKERILGMLAVSIPMAVLGILTPGSFGGGDAKFSFACGAFLGTEGVVRGTVRAVLLAGIYSVWLLFRQSKRKDSSRQLQFAFGPFLCVGYLLETWMLWSRIMENL